MFRNTEKCPLSYLRGLILEKIYHLSVGKNEIFRYIRVSVEEGAGGFHCTYSVKQLFQTTHNSFSSGEGLRAYGKNQPKFLKARFKLIEIDPNT